MYGAAQRRRPAGAAAAARNARSQQLARIDADAVAKRAIVTAGKLAKRHPIISLSWVAGLALSILGTGFTPAPEVIRTYQDTVDSLDVDTLATVESRVMRAQHQYDRSKGWFWRCNDRCQLNKKDYLMEKAHFDHLMAQYRADVADAKSKLGVFSTFSVTEARNLFYGKIKNAKAYAKRSTFFDMVFVGIRSIGRDEDMGDYIMHILIRLLQNITVGLLGAIVSFGWGIWSIVFSYQPDPFQAVFFGLVCILAAVATIATWFAGIGLVGAGAVYGMAKAAQAGRIEGGPRQGQLQGQQHYSAAAAAAAERPSYGYGSAPHQD